MAPSSAALVTKVLSMIIRMLWRVVTLTMLIVFLRQARPLFPNEYKSIEKDLRQAFATEDDNTVCVSNSDDDDEEYAEDSEIQSLNNDSNGVPGGSADRVAGVALHRAARVA